jgi:predicted CXXCH cytochrome family protein
MLFRAATIILALILSCVAAQARTVIMHPIQDSVTTEVGGIIIGFCDDPGKETILLKINNHEETVDLWDGIFEFDSDWIEGDNTITAGDAKVTFVMDEYAEKPREPAVHAAMMMNCANCHKLGVELDLKLRMKVNKLCGGCHKKHDKKLDHADAECTDCHEHHFAWEEKLLKAKKLDLCLGCHEKKKPSGGDDPHSGSWTKLGCSKCHEDSHLPTDKVEGHVCMGCHEGRSSAIGGHDEEVRDHCQTCHMMHRSTKTTIWKDPQDSCFVCHEPPAFEAHRKGLNNCDECHGVHKELQPPSRDSKYCTNCHTKMAEKDRLHGPEATGTCVLCHQTHDLLNLATATSSCVECHEQENMKEGHTGLNMSFDTCTMCHRLHDSDESFFLYKNQHLPFAIRDCNACHGLPGFSSDRKYSGKWVSLCLECHEDFAGRIRHGPALKGECDVCHVPHAGHLPKLLNILPEETCLGCHENIIKVWAPESKHARMGGCKECHEPHGVGVENNLKFEPKQGCLSCHRDPTLGFGDVVRKYVHGPMNMGDCTICHNWHSDYGNKQLSDTTGNLCAQCHEQEWLNTSNSKELVVHKPVAEGHCNACHNPHSADNQAFLKFVGNDLCLKCHDMSTHRHSLNSKPRISSIQVPKDWPLSKGKLSCSGCHKGHMSTEKAFLPKDRESLCQTCHINRRKR